MNKQQIVSAFNSFKNSVVKHSPEILTGIGIAGMVTTTVLAVKATPKALRLIEEAKEDQDCDDLSAIEVVKTTWKCYVPATLTGAASIACLIGASSVSLKRNAALATAYELSRNALVEYKEKVVETIGEKKEQKVRDQISQDKVDNNPVSKTEVLLVEKGNQLCYDEMSGRYFKSDIETIKKAVNELNRNMISEMYISLNDFYSAIGLSCTRQGDQLGWNIDEGLLDVNFGSVLADDGTACVAIRYHIAPRYDFSKLM